ncbi:MAG: CPBP family intramembrane metalloprotease [Lacinutrix sp.]|uniref:CPBP family intramembrane glutamic endopeptidase n=1 Tax=Lacinutrix sp. TaxID=1937692 RepID=UPI0030960E79
MNFIQQAFKVKHDFWRYLVGSVIVFIAAIIGQIPYMVAAEFKAMSDGKSILSMNEQELMSVLEPNLNLFLMLLSFAFGLAALFLVVKFLHKQSIKSVTTARSKIDWKRVWFAFIFWGIISSGMVLLDYYLAPEGYVWNFELERFLILAVIAILLIPIQTSTEEYIFRGYLMQGFAAGTLNKKFLVGIFYSMLFVSIYLFFKSFFETDILAKIPISGFVTFIIFILSVLILLLIDFILTKLNFFNSEFYNNIFQKGKNKVVPLLLTSVIFGGMHVFNPEVSKLGYLVMVYYIGTGLFLGIITLMDEGMELALGFHAANNLFGALLVTADWSVLQTHSIFKDTSDPGVGFTDIVLPVFIIFPIIIFIFAKVYKWKNWKERLFGKIVEPPQENYKVLD